MKDSLAPWCLCCQLVQVKHLAHSCDNARCLPCISRGHWAPDASPFLPAELENADAARLLSCWLDDRVLDTDPEELCFKAVS